jgi:protease-4
LINRTAILFAFLIFNIGRQRHSIKSGNGNRIFYFLKKIKTALVAAAGFDSGSNDNEYVAVINLKDPIYKYSQECGPTGTKSKCSP